MEWSGNHAVVLRNGIRLISGGSAEPVRVHDLQLAEHPAPVSQRHSPLLGNLMRCKIQSLQERCIARKYASLLIQTAILVFATPIYYYEMSGVLKTMLDRANPLYPSDYQFRDVYAIATAAENEEYVPQRAFSGIEGWVDCFDKAKLTGTLFCGGVTDIGEISENAKLQEAFDMGKNI